tara:strand:+ start:604 stop:831 length:228 start_codon:yes stop_codon:yes gene_type:complete
MNFLGTLITVSISVECGIFRIAQNKRTKVNTVKSTVGSVDFGDLDDFGDLTALSDFNAVNERFANKDIEDSFQRS